MLQQFQIVEVLRCTSDEEQERVLCMITTTSKSTGYKRNYACRAMDGHLEMNITAVWIKCFRSEKGPDTNEISRNLKKSPDLSWAPRHFQGIVKPQLPPGHSWLGSSCGRGKSSAGIRAGLGLRSLMHHRPWGARQPLCTSPCNSG